MHEKNSLAKEINEEIVYPQIENKGKSNDYSFIENSSSTSKPNQQNCSKSKISKEEQAKSKIVSFYEYK